MSHIVFDDTLRTGIDDVDDQHAALVAIYNDLVDAYHIGLTRRDTGEILARLLRYAQMHFESEEALMALHGYEGLDEHRVEHAELLSQLRGFVLRMAKHEESISMQILDFVANWITHHIRESDVQFVPTVREGMARTAEGVSSRS